jgi:short-subunit dehydrogenase
MTAGFATILFVRDKVKGEALCSEMMRKHGSQAQCDVVVGDVSRPADIHRLAMELSEINLHLLINNAAVTPPVREETNGIEQQWYVDSTRSEGLKSCARTRSSLMDS